MLPNQEILAKVQQQILSLPNKRKESKRREHYCLFLLGYNSGLRVSEAINFDLSTKSKRGLYRLNKTKGQKKRFVYIPKQVIKELKANNWKPNQTNRWNFYHFLRKIKRELGIGKEIELTPHTLRRAFATYHAEAGLSLPLLQKLLGHASIRTTALYWRNIYSDGDGDTDDILTAKNWLDTNVRQKPCWKPPLEPESPVNLNLGELPELLIPNSLTSKPQPNYLTKIKHLESQLNQIQTEKNQKIKELTHEKEALQNDLANLNQQNNALQQAKVQAITENKKTQQDLTTTKETINQLTQELANERGKKIETERNLAREKAMLFTQKQINSNLQQQLQTEQEKNNKLQAINANLNQKLNHQEQNHTNLLNTYQITLKDKAKIEALAQSQKQRADYYKNQLKSIAETLHQWQKANYYQQLEKQKAQIIHPPPWKIK